MKLLAAVYKIFYKDHFFDGEVGGGSDGMNAICHRPEVADDVASGENAETTFREYV